METTIAPPRQKARYVAIDEPASIEGYVDELVQGMGDEGLRLFDVVPMRRGGDTIGLWLFFSEVAIPVQQTIAPRSGR